MQSEPSERRNSFPAKDHNISEHPGAAAKTAVPDGLTPSGDLCRDCGKKLTFNERGATKRFINRGSTVFYCRECLSKRLGITPEFLDRKIEHFKRQGCTLFV